MTVSSHLHLDCGTCLCTFTRSSTTLLMNCGWRNSAVFCVICACSCGASFITETVSIKIGSGTSTSTICSSIHSGVSLRPTVFAGVVNVAQRVTRLSSWCQVLSVSSPNPSVNVFPRILTGSLSCNIDLCSSFLTFL